MTERLQLGAPLADAIIAHARAELPNEACGLLAGSTATGVATAFHPARNAHRSPFRYDLDPDDLVRLVFAIERAGDELLAIVHSHPRSAAEPSPTDRRAAQHHPGTLQLVVSLAADPGRAASRLRAWRIGPKTVEELALTVG